MKKLFVSLTILAMSLGALADEQFQENGIKKEVWSCKKSSNSKDTIESLTVTINHEKNSSSGSLMDPAWGGKIQLIAKNKSGNLADYLLTAEAVTGHDQQSYEIQLVKNFPDEYQNGGKQKGQAIIIASGFADCAGAGSGASLMDCDVAVEVVDQK